MTMEPLVVHITPGTPKLHIWCDVCLTAARYEVDLNIVSDEGVSTFSTVRSCMRCDEQDD